MRGSSLVSDPRGQTPLWAVLVAVAMLVPAALGRSYGAPARPWFSKQFSAQVVGPDPADPQKKVTQRLYVGAGALRLEEPAPAARVFIYDRDRDRTLVLFPARKQYREVRGAVGSIADLLPKPGGNPCAGGPVTKNVTCRKTGSERIGGRVADRWEVVFEAGGRKLVARRWVDRELGVWLRHVTYEGATFELVGIRVGSQPASLFQVPRDYRPAGR